MSSPAEQAEPDGRRADVPAVLAFHKLTNRITFGSTNYSPRRFGRLLSAAIVQGYQFSRAEESWSDHHMRKLAVTFDDGYAHLHDTLPPLMQEFDFKPTVFVPTGWIGKGNHWDYSSRLRVEPHLDRSGIKELASLGVEFGSHGHSHRNLTRMDNTELEQELLLSKEILEEITGAPVCSISYPFGGSDRRVIEAALRAGFTHGYGMKYPKPNDDQLTLGRFPVYFFNGPRSFLQKMGHSPVSRFHATLDRGINFLSSGTTLLNRLTRQRNA
jgi:peptidoglycan/xylan/chitin deacetylase (PgdA/CDA1 family)